MLDCFTSAKAKWFYLKSDGFEVKVINAEKEKLIYLGFRMKQALFLILYMSLTACTVTKTPRSDWASDELFVQLSELRQEIKIVKKDLSELSETVRQLKEKKVKGQKNTGLQLNLKGTYPLGNEKAKVAIVEFTDYQCPFCLKHNNKTLPLIKKQYIDSGKIKYIVKDYPLGFHNLALSAALSTRCAGKQGKYWDMHDLIFANQRALKENVFTTFAAQLSLDMTLFAECLKDTAMKGLIENDMTEAEAIGVQGTPAFFLGKVKDNRLVKVKALYGAQSFKSFSRVLDSLIK